MKEYRTSEDSDVNLDRLIGNTVKEITVSSDRKTIIFLTDNEEKLTFYTEADCCNDIWIESIERSGVFFRLGVNLRFSVKNTTM